jgi:NADH:ubiquinone oxidoreductase subunit 2 (subunit N)
VLIRLLAALPFLGILVGSVFLNRVNPLIAGLPTLLAWLVMWVVLTSAIMGLIYLLDPENRGPPDGGTGRSAQP